MATQEKLFPKNSPILTSYVEASLARVSALLEKGEGLTIHEARSFLRLHGLSSIKDLSGSSWKTSRACFRTMKGERSEPSSIRWGNWGIDGNTRFSTARISVCHKTGNASSLSDILEKEVDERYFLSEKAVKGLLMHDKRHKEMGHGFKQKWHQHSPKGTTKEETT